MVACTANKDSNENAECILLSSNEAVQLAHKVLLWKDDEGRTAALRSNSINDPPLPDKQEVMVC